MTENRNEYEEIELNRLMQKLGMDCDEVSEEMMIEIIVTQQERIERLRKTLTAKNKYISHLVEKMKQNYREQTLEAESEELLVRTVRKLSARVSRLEEIVLDTRRKENRKRGDV